MNAPLKISTSVDDQIQLLSGRGMVIHDVAHARRWLEHVGYYRLSGYYHPYRLPPRRPGDPRQSMFAPGTRFDTIADLYEFDRKLRTLVHDATERIEVALRAQVSRQLADVGPESYRDASVFRPQFDHARWIQTVDRRIHRAARSSEPIKHHQSHYSGRFPVWVAVDTMDFSDVSLAFEGLGLAHQRTIAESFGIVIDRSQLSGSQRQSLKRQHPLTRWFEKLTIVRNTAAHHSRLWNRSLIPTGTAALKTVSGLETLSEAQSENVHDALVVTNKLLQAISPGTSWTRRISELMCTLDAIPGRHSFEMGFPENWSTHGVWAR